MITDSNINDSRIDNGFDKQYVICNCDEKIFLARAEEFSELCRQSFAEHLEKNVKMGPGYMTVDKWIEISNGCIGQYIEDTGRIIAFWLVHPDFEKKEAYGKILAVDPEYKGNHLGLNLSHSISNYLRELNLNVFWTDTSLKAPHVVKFHKRYGCKAVGMTSWSNTNYYTVLLRLALTPESEISDHAAKRRFFFSKIKCKALLQEDGTSTLIYKILYPVINLCSRVKRWYTNK